jgi:hypothetical protein
MKVGIGPKRALHVSYFKQFARYTGDDHLHCAVVAPCVCYSPLTYDEEVLYPARRTSEVAT